MALTDQVPLERGAGALCASGTVVGARFGHKREIVGVLVVEVAVERAGLAAALVDRPGQVGAVAQPPAAGKGYLGDVVAGAIGEVNTCRHRSRSMDSGVTLLPIKSERA